MKKALLVMFLTCLACNRHHTAQKTIVEDKQVSEKKSDVNENYSLVDSVKSWQRGLSNDITIRQTVETEEPVSTQSQSGLLTHIFSGNMEVRWDSLHSGKFTLVDNSDTTKRITIEHVGGENVGYVYDGNKKNVIHNVMSAMADLPTIKKSKITTDIHIKNIDTSKSLDQHKAITYDSLASQFDSSVRDVHLKSATKDTKTNISVWNWIWMALGAGVLVIIVWMTAKGKWTIILNKLKSKV